MSNPNTVQVWSPTGEGPFEMSRVNARDLCTHRKWSMSPPGDAPAAAEPASEETPADTEEVVDASTDSEGSVEDAETDAEETEAGEAEEASEEEVTEEASEEEAADEVSFEDFAALEDREAAVDYLAEHFPDFKPHHKAGRDSLVEKIVELTNAG